MKKFTLLFIFGIILVNFVSLIYAAENCKIVWPQFGVVSCEVFYGSSPGTETKTPSCSGNICSFSFSCSGKSECKVNSYDIKLDCPRVPCLEYSIYKDGSLLGNNFGWGSCIRKSETPVVIENFNTLSFDAKCTYYLGDTKVDPSSKITMSYRNKYLYDTNPDYPKHKVDVSVGCVPNGIMYKSGYTSRLPSSWVDSNGNPAPNGKPSNAVDNLPTNIEVGNTYSYFYSWREVPGINLVMGKDGNPSGYCGGSLGDRKLLSYSRVDASDGCYVVPTSVQKNVECCYNEDCKWKDVTGKYVCNPTTSTCSLERPCNSDYECQVIGEETCANNVQTSWKCDLTATWLPYKGTCKKSIKNVACCSDNDCSSKEYCDKELGCKPKYTLSDCPAGKCCVNGGNYKEKLCNGMECCTNGGYVGDCKESCQEKNTESTSSIKESSSSGITGNVIGVGGKGSSLIIGVILLVLIGAGLTVYFLKKKKGQAETPNSNCCEESKKTGKKFCVTCGKEIIEVKKKAKKK